MHRALGNLGVTCATLALACTLAAGPVGSAELGELVEGSWICAAEPARASRPRHSPGLAIYQQFGLPLGRCGFQVARADWPPRAAGLAAAAPVPAEPASVTEVPLWAGVAAVRPDWMHRLVRLFGGGAWLPIPAGDLAFHYGTGSRRAAAVDFGSTTGDWSMAGRIARLDGQSVAAAVAAADLASHAPIRDRSAATICPPAAISAEPDAADDPAPGQRCRAEFLLWLARTAQQQGEALIDLGSQPRVAVGCLAELTGDPAATSGELEVLALNRQSDGLQRRPPRGGHYDWSAFYRNLPRTEPAAGVGLSIADRFGSRAEEARGCLARIVAVETVEPVPALELIIDGPWRFFYLRHERSEPAFSTALAAANARCLPSEPCAAAFLAGASPPVRETATVRSGTADAEPAQSEPGGATVALGDWPLGAADLLDLGLLVTWGRPPDASQRALAVRLDEPISGGWAGCDAYPAIAARVAPSDRQDPGAVRRAAETSARARQELTARQIEQLIRLAAEASSWLDPLLNVAAQVNAQAAALAQQAGHQIVNQLIVAPQQSEPDRQDSAPREADHSVRQSPSKASYQPPYGFEREGFHRPGLDSYLGL